MSGRHPDQDAGTPQTLRNCPVCRHRKPTDAYPLAQPGLNNIRIASCSDCFELLSDLAKTHIRRHTIDRHHESLTTINALATRKRTRNKATSDGITHDAAVPSRLLGRRKRRKLSPWSKVKKHKREPVRIPEQATCRICVEDKPASEFATSRSDLPSKCYKHLNLLSSNGAVCKACISASLASALDLKGADRAGCLDCDHVWDAVYVQRYLSHDGFSKYAEQMFHTFIATHKDIVYCPVPSCLGGGIIDMLRPGYPQLECSECKARICGVCKVRWHAGSTCQEWREQHGLADDAEEGKLLNKLARQDARRCSHCQLAVLKDGGCDNMYCGSTNYDCDVKMVSN
jgi:IBR domain, a half RING-finger domain